MTDLNLNSKNISPTCPLCKQDFDIYYRTPRVVPKCGHTYCQRCISSHLSVKASRKVFICPECSSEVVIRKGVQEDVPKNIGIIDVVKNLKKYSTNQKQQQRKSFSSLCNQHQRPLQLVCQSCSFKKICSHCVLFGEHKSHNYGKQAPATNINLREVKEVYQLLTQSVKLVLLPDSENNLKRTIKEKISQGLKKNVKSNFKQYYDIMQKKQNQLLQECDNIVINQGGIDKNIDKLVIEYDNIKNKYEIDWSFAIEHSSLAKQQKSISSLEDFIEKCQELHNKVISIKDQAFQHIEQIIKSIGVRISQAVMFKIQQLPFSLKRLVQATNSQQNQNELTSPNKKTRLKSTNAQVKTKSVFDKEEGRGSNSQINERNKSQSKSVINKKSKNSYSQIDRQQYLQDDFSILQPGKSELTNVKQQTQNQKELKQLISNKGERGSLPPKASKPKNISDYDSKTMNLKPFKEQQKSKSVLKQIIPAKTVSLVNNKQPTPSAYSTISVQQLRFVRPTKEISFQLLSKFQQIMVQTDRQLQQNTLQLVSLQINDTLLLYLLDYLRVKKHRFQVIKLVKNAITDQGLKIILGYLVNDTSTQLLNLTSNQLTPKSLELILLFAQKNNSLKTIYLGGNKINGYHVKGKKNQLSKFQLEIIV